MKTLKLKYDMEPFSFEWSVRMKIEHCCVVMLSHQWEKNGDIQWRWWQQRIVGVHGSATTIWAKESEFLTLCFALHFDLSKHQKLLFPMIYVFGFVFFCLLYAFLLSQAIKLDKFVNVTFLPQVLFSRLWPKTLLKVLNYMP